MGLATAFTEMFGVEYPIALAPMGGSAGGALAGAVSRGGGLGLLGGGGGDEDWLARELPVLVDEAAGKPWGIGFLSWAVDVAVVARALEHGPTAMMLSFGDPGPFVEHIRSAGAVPARPSTSSTTCRPRPTWSEPWLHRPRPHCPEQADADRGHQLGSRSADGRQVRCTAPLRH
ncbi:nitronate monooxygenase [Streptomyces sp. NPDC002722]|uniref:nitronate monooxygenase n=1 Tax=unclassified Streptomyces TaxID=2593676 RepID=UPI0033346B4B